MVEINQEAYDTFWYWINERQKIGLAKASGEPKPWSEDPIFQNWKFCNVFRTDDKQTKWLYDNILEPHHDDFNQAGLANMIFNIYAFRAFNWYETYDLLRNVQTGWINMWNENHAKSMLSSQVHSGHQLTSGAYMIRGVQGKPKYESIPETLTHVWKKRLYLLDRIQDEPVTTMEDMYDLLLAQKFYGWGPFTTYQIVLDLTYTRFLRGAADINTWCMFGPGAKRGLNLIYPGIKNSQLLEATKMLWEAQHQHRQTHVPFLTLQDIEFSLCELSKYMRIKRGGKSKEKYAGRA